MRYHLRTSAMLGLMVVAVAAQGCAKKHNLIPATNATASPTPTPTSSATALAVLVPGTTNQYTGTQTAVITFASPSATTPNSNAAYTVAETDTISTANSGAPAAFDVHRAITYAVTAPATYGQAPATLTQDLYENLTPTSSGAETVTLAEVDGSSTGTDLTSVLANGGSGADTATTTNKFSPNQTLATYPLTSGTSYAQTLAQVATTQESVATATTTESENLSTTYAADDSFDRSGTILNGDSTQQNANSDGSGSVNDTGPSPFSETIGVPSNAGGTYTIPITRNGTSFSINDYYPGGAAAPSPLGSTTVSVNGSPSLPSICPTTYSNVAEIDTNSSSLDVIAGTLTTIAQQEFNSNGLRICGTTTTTVSTYSLTTGGLKETAVTTTATTLSSTATSSAARKANARKSVR